MNANKFFIIGVVVAAVVVFAALSFRNKAAAPSAVAGTDASGAASGTDATGASTFTFDPSLMIRSHSPTRGPADAPVTIVEFMDPQCEACASMHPIVLKLLAEYKGRVRLVYRFMTFHSESLYASSLLQEANDSGKFEKALDIFTDHLHDWGGHGEAKPELLVDYMTKAGIDKMRTTRDYVLKKQSDKIKMDGADGEKLGVNRTPTFFVNGIMLQDIGYEPLKTAIEAALPK